MRIVLPALLVLLMAVPALASAQVYQWTDAHGTTHFTAQPPPAGVKYRTLKLPAQGPRMDSAAPPHQGMNTPSRPATEHQRASKNQEQGAGTPQLKHFCAQIQSNISLLKSNQSLQSLDASRKARVLDEQARKQQLKQQQQRYKAYCEN